MKKEKIYIRLREILKGKKGIKKALAGQYVYGFLVALRDFGILTEKEYQEIRNLLISEFGYFA